MQTYDLSLAGHVALVTGAARNLPAVIAAEFAATGGAVAINDVAHQDQAEALAASINNEGGQAAVFMADVTDQEQLARLVAAVQKELGTVDILINGAGPFAIEPFPQLSEDDWDRVMDANLKAVYMLAKLVAPGMKARGWGRIINVSAGSADLRNHSIYGLSKWGVRHLTESLALELGPEITVNAISPGQIAESAPDISEIDPTFIDRAIAWTPVGRLVTRPEIARLMVMMCSPLFDIVTGETLRMDGGWGIPRW